MILLLYANQLVKSYINRKHECGMGRQICVHILIFQLPKKKKFRFEQNITRRMRKWRLLLSGMSCHVVL